MLDRPPADCLEMNAEEQTQKQSGIRGFKELPSVKNFLESGRKVPHHLFSIANEEIKDNQLYCGR
jgi:hypothetical protein